MINKTLLYTDTCLSDLLDVLDQLHSAASEGYLDKLTTMNKAELLELLRDVIYTAQETVAEVEGDAQREAAFLRLLPKAAGQEGTELHH
jgi:hypothetical protein